MVSSGLLLLGPGWRQGVVRVQGDGRWRLWLSSAPGFSLCSSGDELPDCCHMCIDVQESLGPS